MAVLKRTFTTTPGVPQKIFHDLNTTDIIVQFRTEGEVLLGMECHVEEDNYVTVTAFEGYDPAEAELFISY